jgi:hypothetical protein
LSPSPFPCSPNWLPLKYGSLTHTEVPLPYLHITASHPKQETTPSEREPWQDCTCPPCPMPLTDPSNRSFPHGHMRLPHKPSAETGTSQLSKTLPPPLHAFPAQEAFIPINAQEGLPCTSLPLCPKLPTSTECPTRVRFPPWPDSHQYTRCHCPEQHY